ncbi:MAG: tetratricopeptide repeat protein [Blastomonas sp.]
MALTPQNPPANPGRSGQNDDERQNVFLREVDEALREDQFGDFVRRFGWWIVGAIAAGLLGLAGWLYYNSHKKDEAGLRGEEFVTALDAVKRSNFDGAAGALAPLQEADQDGYRAAAQLFKGALDMERDNPKEAAKAFARLAADTDAPKPYRDLALIRQTASEYDSLKPEEVISRLKPLAVPGNPWFGSAGEMVALAHMRAGKRDLAGAMFLQLSEDEGVPDTIKQRAQQMAGLMGVDALGDPNKLERFAPPPAGAMQQPQAAPSAQ